METCIEDKVEVSIKKTSSDPMTTPHEINTETCIRDTVEDFIKNTSPISCPLFEHRTRRSGSVSPTPFCLDGKKRILLISKESMIQRKNITARTKISVAAGPEQKSLDLQQESPAGTPKASTVSKTTASNSALNDDVAGTYLVNTTFGETSNPSSKKVRIVPYHIVKPSKKQPENKESDTKESERKLTFKFYCDKKICSNENLLQSGNENTDSMPSFTCDYCGAKYNIKDSLISHIRKKHTMKKYKKGEIFKCDYCQEEFQLEQQLINHILSLNHILEPSDLQEKEEKQEFSEMQEKSDGKQESVKINVNSSVTDDYNRERRTFKCNHCNKRFLHKGRLIQHYRKLLSGNENTDNMPTFTCDYCGLKYILRSSLVSHMRNKHMVEMDKKTELRKFKCNHCDKRYFHKEHLNQHLQKLKLSIDMPTYSCDHCGLRYIQRNTLLKHIRRKHMVKMDKKAEKLMDKKAEKLKCEFKYNHCDKRYYDKDNLIQHLQKLKLGNEVTDSADSIPTYACDHCDLKYLQSAHLFAHMRNKHTARKDKKAKRLKLKFKCNHCGKRYSYKGRLIRHLQKLQCSTPKFKCDHCGLKFSRKTYLLFHMRNKHIVKKAGILSSNKKSILKCYCDKIFDSKANLLRHIKKNHTFKQGEHFRTQDDIVKKSQDIQVEHLDIENAPQDIQEEPLNMQEEYRDIQNDPLRDVQDEHLIIPQEVLDIQVDCMKLKHTECLKKVNKAKIFKCDYCKKKYQYRQKLFIHILRKHKVNKESDANEFEKKLSCKWYCDKKICCKENVVSHIQEQHPDIQYVQLKSLDMQEKSQVEEDDHLNIEQTSLDTQHESLGVQQELLDMQEVSQDIENVPRNAEQESSNVQQKSLDAQQALLDMQEKLQDEPLNTQHKSSRIQQESLQMQEESKDKQDCVKINADSSVVDDCDTDLKPKPFKCNYCDKRYYHKGNLIQHLRKLQPDNADTDSDLFICNYCGLKYSQRRYLITHMRNKHTLKKDKMSEILKCDYCQKEYQLQQQLIIHIQREHVVNKETKSSEKKSILKCYCDKEFSSKSHFLTHIQEQHSDPVIQEVHQESPAGTPKATTFLKKTVHHLGDLDHTETNIVNATYDDIDNPNQNERHDYVLKPSKHNNAVIKTGVLTDSDYALIGHDYGMDSQMVKKTPFVTSSVKKRKTSKGCIKNTNTEVLDILVDGGNSNCKPFKCHNCGKRFRHKRRLIQHLRKLQSGNENTDNAFGMPTFICKYCGLKYLSERNLAAHMRKKHPVKKDKHAEIVLSHRKPFNCNSCDKIYYHKGNLIRHLRKLQPDNEDTDSADSMPKFKCDYCQKEYPLKKHLIIHIQREHAVNAYNSQKKSIIKCYCDKEFSSRAELMNHIQKKHSYKQTEPLNMQQSQGMQVDHLSTQDTSSDIQRESSDIRKKSSNVQQESSDVQFTGLQEKYQDIQDESIDTQHESIDMLEKSVDIQQESSAMQEESIDIQQETLAMQRESEDIEDEALCVLHECSGTEQQSLDMQEEYLDMESDDQDDEPFYILDESSDIEQGSINMQKESEDIEDEPLYILDESSDTEQEPLDMQEEYLDMESEDIDDEPLHILDDSSDIEHESLDLHEESEDIEKGQLDINLEMSWPSSLKKEMARHLQTMHGNLIDLSKLKCNKRDSAVNINISNLLVEKQREDVSKGGTTLQATDKDLNFVELELESEIRKDLSDPIEDIELPYEPQLELNLMHNLDPDLSENRHNINTNVHGANDTKVDKDLCLPEKTTNFNPETVTIKIEPWEIEDDPCNYLDIFNGNELTRQENDNTCVNPEIITCKSCQMTFPSQVELLDHMHGLINKQVKLYADDAKKVLVYAKNAKRALNKSFLNESEMLVKHRVYEKLQKTKFTSNVAEEKRIDVEEKYCEKPLDTNVCCRYCLKRLPIKSWIVGRYDQICIECKRIGNKTKKKQRKRVKRLNACIKNKQFKQPSDKLRTCGNKAKTTNKNLPENMHRFFYKISKETNITQNNSEKNCLDDKIEIEKDNIEGTFIIKDNDLLKPVRVEEEKILVQPHDHKLCKSCIAPLEITENTGQNKTRNIFCNKCKATKTTIEKHGKPDENRRKSNDSEIVYKFCCIICKCKFRSSLGLKKHVARSHLL